MLFVIIAIALIGGVAFFFWSEFAGAGWQPCPHHAVRRMLELGGACRGKKVYDLGAGDGRVILSACKHFGSSAVGVEIEPLRALWCWLRIHISGLRGKAKIRLGNAFNTPLHDADIVTLYLRDWSTNRMKEKFLEELRPGARIVSYHWPCSGWKPTFRDSANDIWVYEIGKCYGR